MNVKTVAPSLDEIIQLANHLATGGVLTIRLPDDVNEEKLNSFRLTRDTTIAALRHMQLSAGESLLPPEVESLIDGDSIAASALLEWIISEKTAIGLYAFIASIASGSQAGDLISKPQQQEQGGSCELLERSSATTFKYRLKTPPSAGGSLANIFRQFEGGKASLRVQDYSIGQTTLEQIFNQFASTQDNPEVAAAAAGK